MKYFLLITSLLTIAACSSTAKKSAKELGHAGKSSGVFGYRNAEELLIGLRSNPENRVRTVQGDFGVWTIVQNSVDYSMWSFTPRTHPAHPSVIKRSPVEKKKDIKMRTETSCGSTKEICDDLIKSFRIMTKYIFD